LGRKGAIRYYWPIVLTAVAIAVIVPSVALHAQWKADLRWAEGFVQKRAAKLALHADRTLEAVDLILHGIVEQIERDLVTPRSAKTVHTSLAKIANQRTQFHRLIVTDRHGMTIHSNDPRLIGKSMERSFSYRAHKGKTKASLFTGELIKTKKGKWAYFAMSRPYFDPRGRFSGVIISILKRSYFDQVLKVFPEDEGYSAALMTQGRRVFATTDGFFENYKNGKEAYPSPFASKDLYQKANGVFEEKIGKPGRVQIVGFSKVRGLPYLVITTFEKKRALADWWTRSYIIAFISILAVVTILFFSKRAMFEAQKRADAEVQLIEAKEIAEQATQAKSDFISNMSHELRTPLNAILGFTQMLDIGGKDNLTEIQQKSISRIGGAGKHLLKLVDETLDLRRIESGHLDLNITAISVGELMEECLSYGEELARQNNLPITLIGDVNRVVQGDYMRVKQVLLNLMSNACKYNRPGGSVKVVLSETSPSVLRIAVQDTGVGIPQAKQDQVFEAFNRLDLENSEIQGTGIGLSISRRLMEAMDGSIDFESQEGVGTTFWIEVPITTI